MKRLASICVVLFALAAVACTDEPRPHLPDFDPDAKVDPAGSLPPGTVPGAGTGGGTADAGSDAYDASQDPDTSDAGDQ